MNLDGIQKNLEQLQIENSQLKDRVWRLELSIHKTDLVKFFKEKEFNLEDLGIVLEKDDYWKPIYTQKWPYLSHIDANFESVFIFDWFIEQVWKDALLELINPLSILKWRTKLMEYKIKLSNISIDNYWTLNFQFWTASYNYNQHILWPEEIKLLFWNDWIFIEDEFNKIVRAKVVDSIEKMIKYRQWKPKYVK